MATRGPTFKGRLSPDWIRVCFLSVVLSLQLPGNVGMLPAGPGSSQRAKICEQIQWGRHSWGRGDGPHSQMIEWIPGLLKWRGVRADMPALRCCLNLPFRCPISKASCLSKFLSVTHHSSLLPQPCHVTLPLFHPAQPELSFIQEGAVQPPCPLCSLSLALHNTSVWGWLRWRSVTHSGLEQGQL